MYPLLALQEFLYEASDIEEGTGSFSAVLVPIRYDNGNIYTAPGVDISFLIYPKKSDNMDIVHSSMCIDIYGILIDALNLEGYEVEVE